MGILGKLFGPSEIEKLKEKGDIEGLTRKLENANYHWCNDVVKALGQIGGERAVEPLIKALEKGGTGEQVAAAYALGEIGDKNAVEPLIRLLEQTETDENVCIPIVKALGQIGDDRAIEALISALSDDIRGRRTALGLLEVPVALAAAYALKPIGERAVEPLIEALGSESGCVRVYARSALELIGEPAVEPLTKVLEHENKNVREGARKILEEIQKK